MNLITGGFGFIGNELARQLAGREEVVLLDNRNRVAPAIDDLSKLPLREIDLTDHAAVAQALRELKPRVVFHLAAIHYIPECNANPEQTLRVNVEATMGLLRASSAAGVEHFIFASSGAVYADSPDPLSEEAPVAPVDIYAWSKWFAEEICRWHAQQHALPVTICRLFNNYGPRETNLHILPEILKQARNGDELRLGNTTTRRDYVHTRDTARALIALAGLPPERHRVVNVGTGVDASVEDLVALLSEILGRPLRITHDPARLRPVDKQVQCADATKLRELTGWRPSVTFRDGLTELLRFEGLHA